MKRNWKRMLTFLTVLTLLFVFSCNASAEDAAVLSGREDSDNLPVSDLGVADGSLDLACKGAVLMEATTGAILYMQNADEALPPASVTKVMTLLLVMESVDEGTIHLDDIVTVSANAASMGGSQVFLKEGEQMTLEDMLKSVVIASANDAAVALAEYLCGSVTAFVEKMNLRAKQLGMENTVFENVTGLDDTAENHRISARDIAIMSRELLRHPTILQYSSIWMDTIRDGAFGLTNTNRLVRFYRGCTGLKTGSTSKAGFCVSVSAERNDLLLICVIMGAESGDARNAMASTLLDWGFANYGLYSSRTSELEPLRVIGGKSNACRIAHASFSCVLPRGEISSVESKLVLPQTIDAPIRVGDTVGTIEFYVGDRMIGTLPVSSLENVEKISFFDVMGRIFIKSLLI